MDAIPKQPLQLNNINNTGLKGSKENIKYNNNCNNNIVNNSINYDEIPLNHNELINNIPLCEIFYPTTEEFEDCMSYINSDNIQLSGKKHGIIQIMPPLTWKPSYHYPFNNYSNKNCKFWIRQQKVIHP